MLTRYSGADELLFQQSSGALYSCTLQPDSGVQVIDVSDIDSVVAMIPHSLPFLQAAQLGDTFKNRVFVVERPGLEVMALGETLDTDNDE